MHIATFTSLSFAFDPLIVWLAYKAAEDVAGLQPHWAVVAQLVFMFWTKVIKLIALFIRNPADLQNLPVSILFGWFHGGIKLWALFTLKMVFRVPVPFPNRTDVPPDFLGQPCRR